MMQQILLGQGGVAVVTVDDVFSVDTYTGNGSTQTITNGVNLSGEGGMVWAKSRSDIEPHSIIDNERGLTSVLNTSVNGDASTRNYMDSFNSNGFTLDTSDNRINGSGKTYVSWTFRKASKFFDVVKYTGNGTMGRTVSHNLGAVPGMIWVKQTDGSSDWIVYHKGLGNTKFIRLNTSGAAQTFSVWNNTTPTATEFTVGTLGAINGNGNEFVAFLFADDDLMSFGTYAGNETSSKTINVGFEPQLVMVKALDNGSVDWFIWDTTRGIGTANNADKALRVNTDETEGSGNVINTTSTGFTITSSSLAYNGDADYIYWAIAAS